MIDAQYSREDRLRKLQKLRDLADHPATETPLADSARAQYEKLLRLWEIDPDSIESEKPKEWTFKMPPSCEMIFAQAMHHLDLKGWKPKKFRITIVATESEKELYYTLVSLALSARKQKQAEQKKALASYTLGMVNASFPTGPAKCPKCASPSRSEGGAYLFNPNRRRYICEACGYIGRAYPKMHLDPEAMEEGREAAARLRPERLIENGTKASG